MSSLYEITDDIRTLLDSLSDDGELTDEQADALDALSDTFEAKAENVALYIRNLDAEAGAYKIEMDRLKRQHTIRKNKMDWLKLYLYDHMKELSIAKIKGKVVELRIQKSPPKVVVEHEGRIPDGYWVKLDPVLDMAEINRELKDTGEVPGCKLVQGSHLRIV